MVLKLRQNATDAPASFNARRGPHGGEGRYGWCKSSAAEIPKVDWNVSHKCRYPLAIQRSSYSDMNMELLDLKNCSRLSSASFLLEQRLLHALSPLGHRFMSPCMSRLEDHGLKFEGLKAKLKPAQAT